MTTGFSPHTNYFKENHEVLHRKGKLSLPVSITEVSTECHENSLSSFEDGMWVIMVA